MRAVVLAVDDSPENLDVVKRALVPEYTVKVATSGALALKIAEKQPPDIILLDVMMPEMDGYEVCRRLKSDPATAEIPIIFLTAKDQTADETEGFSLGGADYIHKPVNREILKARVATHVELKQSIDNLHELSEALARAKQRMENELNVGHDLQRSMLPAVVPDSNHFDLCASMDAAREVSGDFYDYFMLNDEELWFCVADVSGKGVPAALFMAMTKILLKSRSQDDRKTSKVMTRVNAILAEDNAECMFVTVFLGVLQVRSGTITYTNAGHNLPFIKRANGALETVPDSHGPILGVQEGREYGESSIELGPEDMLLVYTDGVTEAMDVEGQLYSGSRLENVLQSIEHPTAEALLKTVHASVDEFAHGAEQADDITMIALRFIG
jgi:sigma-B regulation protein RsbU (phosphoserine phosphatase)